MTKRITDHVAPSELVADFHDQVSVALRFRNRLLRGRDHACYLTLVDWHAPARREKVLLEVDEQQRPAPSIRYVRHRASMAPPAAKPGQARSSGRSRRIPAGRERRRPAARAPICQSALAVKGWRMR